MKPAAPPGLRTSGKALWSSVVDEFDLVQHERTQLVQAARLADLLDDLADVVAREGVTITDPKSGASVPHPCVVELRQQRITLARLLAALRVPDAEDVRPQRRAGARGTYRPRGAR